MERTQPISQLTNSNNRGRLQQSIFVLLMDFSNLGEATRIRSRIKTCTICVREHVVESNYSRRIPAKGLTKSRGVVKHDYNGWNTTSSKHEIYQHNDTSLIKKRNNNLTYHSYSQHDWCPIWRHHR
jgi:hypothetical protein